MDQFFMLCARIEKSKKKEKSEFFFLVASAGGTWRCGARGGWMGREWVSTDTHSLALTHPRHVHPSPSTHTPRHAFIDGRFAGVDGERQAVETSVAVPVMLFIFGSS